MQIVVTGAAGLVGREVVAALDAVHDLQLIDCQPVPGRPAWLADISRLPAESHPRAWTDAFAGTDIVVHLAEDPRPHSDWQRVLHNNIAGTWNVLWTAAEKNVHRVVYASSHWAVRLLEPQSESALAGRSQIGTRITPRPDTPYGVAKVGGESLGRMLVDIGTLRSFVAVRIGSYDHARPNTEHYRQYGITGPDLRNLFRRCVEAEFVGFHVVYGVSNANDGPFDMSSTCRLLDWEPTKTGQGVR